jgi:peroxiredoxin
VTGVRDLQPGDAFPDLELPDHDGHPRRLSELAGGDPLVLHTYRGWWCPKERAWFRHLVSLQDDAEVAYTRFASLSVDPPPVSAAFRAGLDARWPFLCDDDRAVLRPAGTAGDHRHRARPVPADRVAAQSGAAGLPLVARLLVLGDARPSPSCTPACASCPPSCGRTGPAASRSRALSGVTAWLALLDAPAGDLSAAAVSRDGRASSRPGTSTRADPIRSSSGRPAAAGPARPPAQVSLLWPSLDALPLFDDPAVVRARRTARTLPRPRCTSTFTVDSRHLAGSLYVPGPGGRLDEDPFRLLGVPLHLHVGPGLLGVGPALVGPAQERYSGAPWPSGSF